MHVQELAYAIHHSKPIAVLVLDKEAWDLLTAPHGALATWESSTWGPPLSAYEGQEIDPSEAPFDLACASRLFAHLSSINLCPCRPLEEQNLGMSGILDTAEKHISKDLGYFKELAELKRLSTKWEERGCPKSLLLQRKAAIG